MFFLPFSHCNGQFVWCFWIFFQPLCCKCLPMLLPHHQHLFPSQRLHHFQPSFLMSFLDFEPDSMWEFLACTNISLHPNLMSLGSSYLTTCSLQKETTCDNLFVVNVLQGILFPSHIKVITCRLYKGRTGWYSCSQTSLGCFSWSWKILGANDMISTQKAPVTTATPDPCCTY